MNITETKIEGSNSHYLLRTEKFFPIGNLLHVSGVPYIFNAIPVERFIAEKTN